MQDMWSQMKPVYQELVKNPPTDKALCPCVKDVHNNGVFHNLQGMSLEQICHHHPCDQCGDPEAWPIAEADTSTFAQDQIR